MVKINPETIIINADPILRERKAVGTIKPGHLVKVTAEGFLKKQDQAKIQCQKAFAIENDIVGKGINDEYIDGELVKYGIFRGGSILYARLAAGADELLLGDSLEAGNDGTVAKQTEDGSIIGYAMESVDNSTGLTEVFIKIEAL